MHTFILTWVKSLPNPTQLVGSGSTLTNSPTLSILAGLACHGAAGIRCLGSFCRPRKRLSVTDSYVYFLKENYMFTRVCIYECVCFLIVYRTNLHRIDIEQRFEKIQDIIFKAVVTIVNTFLNVLHIEHFYLWHTFHKTFTYTNKRQTRDKQETNKRQTRDK